MKTSIKFVFSGVINTLFSYATFYLVFSASSSVALALLSGLITGLASSYLLNRFWVWSRGDSQSLKRFLGIQLVFLISNWIVLHFVSLTSFPRTSAQFFIYLFVAPLMYQVNQRFVFQK